MTRLPLLLFLLLLAAADPARAQLGNFGDMPIDINAGETHFETGVAVAEHNVLIRYGETIIYCDYAQYNPDSRDVLALGNVRIFRQGKIFAGERAIYNLESKKLTGSDFRGSVYPFEFEADTFNSIGTNAYQAHGGFFTTSDNSKPDYTLRGQSARIYPNDRLILRDVFLYIGQLPVFWFPYVYQSLNKDQGFTFAPGYTSTFGAYLLTRFNFPITDDVEGTLRVDMMTARGVGLGLDAKWQGTNPKQDWGRFSSYYLYDLDASKNVTDLAREQIPSSRYRVSLQDRTYLTEDIYATIDINKLSDPRLLQDFEPGDFRRDPNPDNVIAFTKWDENYTLTLQGRKSLNEFFDFTERLPELDLDIKRQPIFGQSGLFYEGESSAAFLRRNFGTGSIFADYDSSRFDTFHQLIFPQNFGWLSVVPHAGARLTYYSDSGTFKNEFVRQRLSNDPTDPNEFEYVYSPQLDGRGALWRVAMDTGVETSFKLSRAFEGVQSRAWGLDGLRHVLQPYMDVSYSYTNVDPSRILQFDRINPSTQLPPIDFPQFNSIDSIDNWAIVQLGARNRFETRRDNLTYTWLEWDGFFNININRPQFEKTFLDTASSIYSNQRYNPKASLLGLVADPGTFSNVYNTFKWTPVPWIGFGVDSQLPLLDKGFTEIDTNVDILATQDLQLIVSHRYLSGNVYFDNSDQLSFTALYHLTDNWGISVEETYEFAAGQLEAQRYEVHRDLSSWIASFGFVVENNGGGKEDVGLTLTFTLKDMPLARLPLNLNPSTVANDFGGGSSKNP